MRIQYPISLKFGTQKGGIRHAGAGSDISGLKPGAVFPVGYLPLTRGYTPLVLLLLSSHNGLLSIFGLHHSQIHCTTQQICGSVVNRVGGQI